MLPSPQQIPDVENQVPSKQAEPGRWHRTQVRLERALSVPVGWWPLRPPPQHLKFNGHAFHFVPFSEQRYTLHDSHGQPNIHRVEGIPPSPVAGTGQRSSEHSIEEAPLPKTIASKQPLYLHLCVDITRLHRGLRQVTCLRSIEVAPADPDDPTHAKQAEELFEQIRATYYSFGGFLGWRRRLSLKSLAQINYVKFELTDKDHVMTSSTKPSLPSSSNPHYHLHPGDLAPTDPPISSETFVRYFHRPSEAARACAHFPILDRLPKCDVNILVDGTTPPSIAGLDGEAEYGYGLELVDGLSIMGVLTVVAMGLIGAVVVGVVYSKVKGDPGAATGYAGLVIAVVGVFISVSSFSISRRLQLAATI